jgi:hypothetical protein
MALPQPTGPLHRIALESFLIAGWQMIRPWSHRRTLHALRLAALLWLNADMSALEGLAVAVVIAFLIYEVHQYRETVRNAQALIDEDKALDYSHAAPGPLFAPSPLNRPPRQLLVTITKQTTIKVDQQNVILPVGTQLSLVRRSGSTATIAYDGSDYKIPVSSTDLEWWQRRRFVIESRPMWLTRSTFTKSARAIIAASI